MTADQTAVPILAALDRPTAALVRLSARITGAGEASVREGLAECAAAGVKDRWVEELVLQSYLFAGFPRALNAAREWRRLRAVPAGDGAEQGGEHSPTPRAAGGGESYADLYEWRQRGEATCEIVYGEFYEKLRTNIRNLHPALDDWMIVEGYGKVLARPGLDLARRELCVVAACVAAGQDRQLHSHLHGALHAGVAPGALTATLEALTGVVPPDDLHRARLLLARVIGK
jgi:4-carboxymuconolactone decarboxylase